MTRGKARSREELEQMRKKEAQKKSLVEATANANKKDSATSLDATRVAVAQSSKDSAENNILISKQVQPLTQTKVSEHSKAVQANQRAQKCSRSIVESYDESVEVMESFEDDTDSKPTAKKAFDVDVDYGDEFFSELMKIQDFYCDWRKNHVNEPVVDDSPSFVNESAMKHFDIVERMFDHQSFLYDSYKDYKLHDPGTHQCEIHTAALPQIDKRLFSAKQYFELIVSRCKIGYCQFYLTYFGQGNILNRRVKFARDWIARKRLKNLSKINDNLKDGSKLSMVVEPQLQDHSRNVSSPLPWYIDRVGDIETSKTTVPIAASKTLLTESATLAAVVGLCHAKPPPNQVLGSVNEIAQTWDEVLPSNEVLLESNDMSKFENKALVAENAANSEVRETAINNSSTMEDQLTRVNALKNHPYNYHMKLRPSSGLIWNWPLRKNILSHNQVICLVQHVLDPMDVPLFVTSLETIKLSNDSFQTWFLCQ